MNLVLQHLRAAAGRIPAADARLLMAHALGVPATRLLTAGPPDDGQLDRFRRLVEARDAGMPAQYLIGRAAFRTIEVAVGPGVFIPRPETEVMTGWAIDRLRELAAAGRAAGELLVVELCAGSGAISLAIRTEVAGCVQYAVEISADAMEYAGANLAGTDVVVVQGDMADALPELDGRVDLVIANPPYIPLDAYDGVGPEVRDHEPEIALFSGADGLRAMQVLAGTAHRLLRPGGLVCAEHADVQGRSAPAVFVRHGGFTDVRDHPDLAGRPRFVTARRLAAVAG